MSAHQSSESFRPARTLISDPESETSDSLVAVWEILIRHAADRGARTDRYVRERCVGGAFRNMGYEFIDITPVMFSRSKCFRRRIVIRSTVARSRRAC